MPTASPNVQQLNLDFQSFLNDLPKGLSDFLGLGLFNILGFGAGLTGNLPFATALTGIQTALDTKVQGMENEERLNELSNQLGLSREALQGMLGDLPTFSMGSASDLPKDISPKGSNVYAPDFYLGDLFDVGQARLDAFNELYPQDVSIDLQQVLGPLQQARGDVRDVLQGGRLPFGTLESFVDLPNADLSDMLAGDLAGIGATSQARQAQRQQNLTSMAPAFGGLEQMQRQSEGVAFDEAALRGLEAAGARSATRQREADIEQFNAGLQGDLVSREAMINQGLTLAEAEALRSMGIHETDLTSAILTDNIAREIQKALTGVELRGGAEQDELTAGLFAIEDMYRQLGLNLQVQDSITRSLLNEASIAANAGLLEQPVIDFSQLMGSFANWNQPGGGGESDTGITADLGGAATTALLAAGGGLGAAGGAGAFTSFLPFLGLVSDKRLKVLTRPLEGRQVLERLRKLPLYSWQYKTQQDKGWHLGATAQDFEEAFELQPEVTDGVHFLNPLDAIGVLMAAVQQLAAELDELRAQKNV